VVGGFGQVGFGRCEFGQSKSDVEPRYYLSNPDDNEANISIYQTTIWFSIYGFSSRVQVDSFLYIEISENGGTSFADAYTGGSFVSPYNGSGCLIDDHLGTPGECRVKIEKTAAWANEEQVVVRVTAQDEYENESTKETPEVW
jgi:hypothetical protein